MRQRSALLQLQMALTLIMALTALAHAPEQLMNYLEPERPERLMNYSE